MSDELQEKPDELRKRAIEEVSAAVTSSTYTPLKKKKNDDFASIRRHIIKKLSRNEIDLLKIELQSGGFSKDFIIKFFEEEYLEILHWLLIGSKNSDSSKFIVDTFTPAAIKCKLREDNFSFLARFLNGRAGLEELRLLLPQKRGLDRERFELLLRIDPDGIQEFMEKNKTAKIMKPSTWQDYEIALQTYNTAKIHNVIPPTP